MRRQALEREKEREKQNAPVDRKGEIYRSLQNYPKYDLSQDDSPLVLFAVASTVVFIRRNAGATRPT